MNIGRASCAKSGGPLVPNEEAPRSTQNRDLPCGDPPRQPPCKEHSVSSATRGPRRKGGEVQASAVKLRFPTRGCSDLGILLSANRPEYR